MDNLGERLAHLEAEVTEGLKSLREYINVRNDAVADHLNLLAIERRIATDKFETDVSRRFAQVNEFRAALDDLSQGMATRRELESRLEASKDENTAAFDASRAVSLEQAKQLSELRSRLDVGPAALGQLTAESHETLGERRRSERVMAVIYGVGVMIVGVLSVASAVLIRVIGG